MPRPVQPRLVEARTRTLFFKPSGSLPKSLKRLTLKVEELEALRLADFEGLSQSDAAVRMGVSRHTFGRILASARRISADALVNGIPLEITGGTHAWRQPSKDFLKGKPAMKIAVSAEGPELTDAVDGRFGRAAGFVIYDTSAKTHTWYENGAAQAAAQGAGLMAAELVSAQSVDVVLSGYVGPKAFEALQAAEIRVVQDMDNRTVGEAIAAFEAGEADVLVQKDAL